MSFHEGDNSQPYHTVSSRYLFKSPWRNFREDVVDIGEDKRITYTYAEVPKAIFIVPLTHDGNIVLIRQYRYPVRNWVVEVPAGSILDSNEDPATTALRELQEEVGGSCEGQLIHLAQFYSSSAHINLSSEIYLATGVRLNQEQQLEETELLQRLVMPARKALEMAHTGQISEGQSAYALLLAEPYILALECEDWQKS